MQDFSVDCNLTSKFDLKVHDLNSRKISDAFQNVNNFALELVKTEFKGLKCARKDKNSLLLCQVSLLLHQVVLSSFPFIPQTKTSIC